MKKLVILLVLVMLLGSVVGCCNETQKRATYRNWHYLGDDMARATGLDQPSGLHPRDQEPLDSYEPYRGHD